MKQIQIYVAAAIFWKEDKTSPNNISGTRLIVYFENLKIVYFEKNIKHRQIIFVEHNWFLHIQYIIHASLSFLSTLISVFIHISIHYTCTRALFVWMFSYKSLYIVCAQEHSTYDSYLCIHIYSYISLYIVQLYMNSVHVFN